MNPIQKATYFGILNVLLPLQILTGALMWGVQVLPVIARPLGGLPFLAPIPCLVAWLFATFILVHVYMTTTGATPLEATNAMVTGYEEVEVHEHDGRSKMKKNRNGRMNQNDNCSCNKEKYFQPARQSHTSIPISAGPSWASCSSWHFSSPGMDLAPPAPPPASTQRIVDAIAPSACGQHILIS